MTKSEYLFGTYLTLCCLLALLMALKWPLLAGVVGLLFGIAGGRLYATGAFDID